MSIIAQAHPISTLPPKSNETENAMSTLPPSSLAGRRFFLCTGQCVTFDQLEKYPRSHIIGELRYVTDEGRKVTALAVYESSLHSNNAPVVLPPIRVEIIGDARRIKCTCCHHRERWEIGKVAFMALMQRYGRKIEAP